jgi:glycosyltransferase involved in cell wall biosynthesis
MTRFLFIHQNFPGQFRHVARALADDPRHQVVGLGDAANLHGRPQLHPKVRTVEYVHPKKDNPATHHYLRDFETHLRRGQSVVRACVELRKQGFEPDVVAAHPGWGEGLFLRDVYPKARLLKYFEYYYQAAGGDVGFDPEYPASLDDALKTRVRNSTQLHSLVACDAGISPTNWQLSRFPAELRSKIKVIHEGVDTDAVRPDPAAVFERDGRRFVAGDETVTYVARNLEPYRGFHVFMRSLPKLQALRPNARVLVVGGDEVSYGRRLPEGESYRTKYMQELGDRVDWRRVHFLGRLPYAEYVKVLQVSAAHVYLTYPFVLSWSMLEAMAAGCLVIGSATPPVMEVIREGGNGVLADFFDADALARIVASALDDPARYRALRDAARKTVVERYDLKTRCLPEWLRELTRQN